MTLQEKLRPHALAAAEDLRRELDELQEIVEEARDKRPFPQSCPKRLRLCRKADEALLRATDALRRLELFL